MQYLIEHNYWRDCFKYFSFRYKEAAVQRLYYHDGVYEGQALRSNDNAPKKHGIGIFINNSGDMYFGEFKNGLPDGEANIIFSNGSFFRGIFKNGLYDGLGLFVHVDRDIYLMTFKMGILSGCVTYFPNSHKEVFMLKYRNNQLRRVIKRYQLSTEHGAETKFRVLKSVFENSQLNQILYTATDVHKIIKKVSTSRQKFINSQMIGKDFFYCGVFNNDIEFEGLGMLLDLENKKIRVGDWDKQALNGFGLLIQSKYIFRGKFTMNQPDGDILITNLETGEYKLCFYENGLFRSVIKEGKGNCENKDWEYKTINDAMGDLKRFPGSEFIDKESSLSDFKSLGYDLCGLKLKVTQIEDFIGKQGLNLQESQIFIAIKDEEVKMPRSKSPFGRGSTKQSFNTMLPLLDSKHSKAKSQTRVMSDTKINPNDKAVSFRNLRGSQSRYITITPNQQKNFKSQALNSALI